MNEGQEAQRPRLGLVRKGWKQFAFYKPKINGEEALNALFHRYFIVHFMDSYDALCLSFWDFEVLADVN